MQITHQICQHHVGGSFAGVVLSLYLSAPVMTKQLDAAVWVWDLNCYVAKFHHRGEPPVLLQHWQSLKALYFSLLLFIFFSRLGLLALSFSYSSSITCPF